MYHPIRGVVWLSLPREDVRTYINIFMLLAACIVAGAFLADAKAAAKDTQHRYGFCGPDRR